MKKLYLSELLKRDKHELKGNIFIKSPVGSGKTHTILKDLAPRYTGQKILLVSTTMLKDELGLEEGVQIVKKLPTPLNKENVFLMTYATFGKAVLFSNHLIESSEAIFCDEIHSLLDYYLKHKTGPYGAAIKSLFAEYENTDIFYFTATDEKIDKFIDKEYYDVRKKVKVIDYYDHEEIVRYSPLYTQSFHGTDGLKSVIDGLDNFKRQGKKGVIFNERITSMQETEEHLKKKGFRPISIWSVNNEKNPMTDEQLYVRSMLLKTKQIPEGYDFIIINEAMREGWNLKDPDVELVILNTLDGTNQEQALGRIRKDITLLLIREKDKIMPITTRIIQREKTINAVEKVLGKVLLSADKQKLAEEFDIRREENNTLVKWDTIKKALLSTGDYEIIDKVQRIDGTPKGTTVINRIEKEPKLSQEVKAKRFMFEITKRSFEAENQEFLANYIKQNPKIALSHISKGYITFVVNQGWTERKYADITYLLARDKQLFSKENYRLYGIHYETFDKIEIITERAKYETEEKMHLQILESRKKELEEEMEKELLEYIANNSQGQQEDKDSIYITDDKLLNEIEEYIKTGYEYKRKKYGKQ